MSLLFDRKAYEYNDLSRSILFTAKDGDTEIHFSLPRIALEDHTGREFTADADMWQAFHESQDHIEAVAQAYWTSVSAQHLREGTAAPLGTPFVLVSLDD
jgi:predicted metal-dependent phosphoesterase TrpH